jgi:signal peptidase I
VAERPPDPAPPADPPPAAPAPPPPSERPTRHSSWRSFPVLVVSALLLAILVKSFLIQAFFIPSQSMEPTLRVGDRILVCRICLHVQDIHRGDVLVFSVPRPSGGLERGFVGGALHWLGEGIGIAQPSDPDFIKRVGALSGETWEIRRGDLFVDGALVERPFLDPRPDTRSFGPQTVPDGMLLMLGDDPLESGDSRLTPAEGGLGYVAIDDVIGKAFAIVWPPSRAGRIR